jgi:hypothetical protein
MIYAEKHEEDGGYIKGIFLSMEEFLDYRRNGWSATPEINEMADKAIAEL